MCRRIRLTERLGVIVLSRAKGSVKKPQKSNAKYQRNDERSNKGWRVDHLPKLSASTSRYTRLMFLPITYDRSSLCQIERSSVASTK